MIFSLDFSKLKMVEVSSFVLLSEIEDKIRELDGRNNSIWATLFSIFPNWSVFLVLVPVMSSCWGFELIEPEAWPGNSHGFLILPKVHLYPALWECSCPMCSERPPFMEAVCQNWQLSPFGFSGGGTLGFGGGHFLTCLKIYVNLPVVESCCDPAFSCKGLRHASRLAAFRRGRDVLSQPQGTPYAVSRFHCQSKSNALSDQTYRAW